MTAYQPTRRDLIDLAIEYGMVRSTGHFDGLSAKAQAKVLSIIGEIAATLPWETTY